MARKNREKKTESETQDSCTIRAHTKRRSLVSIRHLWWIYMDVTTVSQGSEMYGKQHDACYASLNTLYRFCSYNGNESMAQTEAAATATAEGGKRERDRFPLFQSVRLCRIFAIYIKSFGWTSFSNLIREVLFVHVLMAYSVLLIDLIVNAQRTHTHNRSHIRMIWWLILRSGNLGVCYWCPNENMPSKDHLQIDDSLNSTKMRVTVTVSGRPATVSTWIRYPIRFYFSALPISIRADILRVDVNAECDSNKNFPKILSRVEVVVGREREAVTTIGEWERTESLNPARTTEQWNAIDLKSLLMRIHSNPIQYACSKCVQHDKCHT